VLQVDSVDVILSIEPALYAAVITGRNIELHADPWLFSVSLNAPFDCMLFAAFLGAVVVTRSFLFGALTVATFC
jgi:hypothetical protein